MSKDDLPDFYAELREHIALENIHNTLDREDRQRRQQPGGKFASSVGSRSQKWYRRIRAKAEREYGPDDDED